MDLAVQRRANWALIIGGIALVICGALIIAAPGFFLGFLTVWAGIVLLVSGITGIASYFQLQRIASGVVSGTGWNLFMAILDIVVGILLIAHPLAFSEIIPWVLSVIIIGFGILEIVGMMPFARFIPETRVIAIVAGVFTITIGVLLFIWPALLSIWIAVFALVRGFSMIASGLAVRV